MPVASLVNNTVIPQGGAVVRRALIQDESGVVHHVRDYYHGGVFKQVTVRVDTSRRGALVPDYKIPDWIRAKITTGPGSILSPGTRPMIPIENPLNQTAVTAPVGTQGVLKMPVTRIPVATFGTPTVQRTIGRAAPAKPARYFQRG